MAPLPSWWPKLELKNYLSLFKELQGSNLEFKLITLKPTTETYFETYLSRFGLAGLPMAGIMDF